MTSDTSSGCVPRGGGHVVETQFSHPLVRDTVPLEADNRLFSQVRPWICTMYATRRSEAGGLRVVFVSCGHTPLDLFIMQYRCLFLVEPVIDNFPLISRILQNNTSHHCIIWNDDMQEIWTRVYFLLYLQNSHKAISLNGLTGRQVFFEKLLTSCLLYTSRCV